MYDNRKSQPKGITPVVAIVLLLLITISLVGISLILFSRTTQTAGEAGEEQLKHQAGQLSAQFKIVSASNNKVYVQNTGASALELETLAFYADGELKQHSGPSFLSPNEVGEYALQDFFPGSAFVMKVTSGFFSDKLIVPVTAPPQFILRGAENTEKIAKEIGEGALSNTIQYDVCGTDLGSMFLWGNKTYIAFGDTFGCPLSATPNWRSNTMAITTDTAPSDGLAFDSWILGADGKAKELFSKDAGAVTVIPTYGISVGNSSYLFYMQVTSWDSPGRWTCDYSSIAVSTDEGQTWSKQSNVIKWNAGNFNQVAVKKVDNYLYIWGIPCGRFGSVKLARVGQNNILDKNQYQHFAGLDTFSSPLWSNSEAGAVNVTADPVGELSVRWDDWLGRYIMMYVDESKAAVVIREGFQPWGPWGSPITVATAAEYPALYGAYMLGGYEENAGETIYFRMSQFFPLYSTYWMKTTLKK